MRARELLDKDIELPAWLRDFSDDEAGKAVERSQAAARAETAEPTTPHTDEARADQPDQPSQPEQTEQSDEYIPPWLREDE